MQAIGKQSETSRRYSSVRGGRGAATEIRVRSDPTNCEVGLWGRS